MGVFKNIFINALVYPIAYNFRDNVKEGGYLWGFLHEGSNYGDATFHPNMKDGFLKSYLWALRNPCHNAYYADFVEGEESNFKGTGTCKYGNDILSWRTFKCSDTGDNNGKVLDFEKSRFGEQDITFIRTDKDGNVQNCYRKSNCAVTKFLGWLKVRRIREGHEKGLMQRQNNFSLFNYNDNKVEFEKWLKIPFKTIVI